MMIGVVVAIFVLAFALAWVIIFTFIQEPFSVTAPARIFGYHTAPIAMYWYVLAAFATGGLLGTGAAVVGYIRARVSLGAATRKVRELQGQVDGLRVDLDAERTTGDELRRKLGPALSPPAATPAPADPQPEKPAAGAKV